MITHTMVPYCTIVHYIMEVQWHFDIFHGAELLPYLYLHKYYHGNVLRLGITLIFKCLISVCMCLCFLSGLFGLFYHIYHFKWCKWVVSLYIITWVLLNEAYSVFVHLDLSTDVDKHGKSIIPGLLIHLHENPRLLLTVFFIYHCAQGLYVHPQHTHCQINVSR